MEGDQQGNQQETKFNFIRRVSAEFFVVISTSIILSMLTTIIQLMETLVRLEEQTRINTELIRELKKEIKELSQ